MLTRLYIDNYRSFVNFECKFDRRHLLMGANGAGKSSLADALGRIRQFVIDGDDADISFPLSMRTRWMNKRDQKWELEARIRGETFSYDLLILRSADSAAATVGRESLRVDGRVLLDFSGGSVHLYDDEFHKELAYPFDSRSSALSTISNRKDRQSIEQFKSWLSRVHCFRLKPSSMGTRALKETLVPNQELSNFASWYRHLAQDDPIQTSALFQDLAECMQGFRQLRIESFGERARELMAEFDVGSGRGTKFRLRELSDGQRCLICLYAILHFLLQKDCTVLIDEPDNFVSLREIQPWLRAADEILDGEVGQLFLISHHPEILNQWAPSYGLQLFREDGGPTRARKFEGGAGTTLTPAELIARGWDDV